MFGLNDDIHEYRGENARLRDAVAELVALLRMRHDLVRAAERAENFTEAYEERERILGLYHDAIAKHGGG